MRRIVSVPRPIPQVHKQQTLQFKVITPEVRPQPKPSVAREIRVPKPVTVGKIQKPLLPSPVVRERIKIKLDKPKEVKVAKKKQPRYVTNEASPESLPNIVKIQNKGLNRILCIIGNGPSISEVPLEQLKALDIDIMSINHPDPRLWPTKYWAFFDSSQIRRHEALWNSYDGIIFNSTAIKKQKHTSMQFKNIPGKSFSFNLKEGLNIGRSSVYAAMQIALWMNYEHIFIFGVDMNPAGINGKLHYYGDNPDVDPKVRASRFGKEAEYYTEAADKMSEEDRRRFFFCSGYNNWPFVNRYNKCNHLTAIDKIRDMCNESGAS